jgi:hypothetical protein
MKREEALTILSANRERLREFSVKSLAVFGSVARDEAAAGSDVDILVEFEAGARIGLFEFIGLKQFLEGILHCPVDLATADAVRERLRARVLKEAILVA